MSLKAKNRRQLRRHPKAIEARVPCTGCGLSIPASSLHGEFRRAFGKPSVTGPACPACLLDNRRAGAPAGIGMHGAATHARHRQAFADRAGMIQLTDDEYPQAFANWVKHEVKSGRTHSYPSKQDIPVVARRRKTCK